MQLERLEFEFDTGIDPLTGEKRPPVRAVSRPEDRFDLYYVAEDKRGHHCGEALCEEIVPVLAKKGNYVLVSYVEDRIIILNEDDEPMQLLPFHDGTWVGVRDPQCLGRSDPAPAHGPRPESGRVRDPAQELGDSE